ncbi:hypothetical protein [Aestuariibacter salexigens]|uniref:hypothetical protein n=1 Tax=Aestuariibacter salexigens TaxID=226010 RepID=UPI00040A4D48|nr:hypothetical protein [Aestuariibacter salexigens]
MFRLLFLIFVALVALSVTAIFLAVEKVPHVVVDSSQQIESADSVSALLTQVRNTVRDRHRSQTLFITREQLNSLAGVLQRARPDIVSQVSLYQDSAIVKLSYQLPAPLTGRFLNISIPILAADKLVLGAVDLGSLTLPGDWVLRALTWFGDWYTNSSIATQSLQQIRSIDFDEAQARVQVGPVDTLIQALKASTNGLGSDANEELRKRTAHYVSYLNRLPPEFSLQERSLADYMQKVMAEAYRRTQEGEVVRENEAALLALAIYAGNHRFASFVGNVQHSPDKAARPLRWPVLAGRQDLSLHFLYSLAIKLLSEQGISVAIGEFKELMDRSPSGSGYSFVDMAADLAGVELALVATDPVTAPLVQERLALGQSEVVFFPDINGLPEGLDKQGFAERFGAVDSPEYRAMMEDIRQRILRLPLYSS